MKFEGVVPSIESNVIEFKRFNNGHWKFPKQMGDGIGFIYVIRDNYLEKFYLGKKRYKSLGQATKGQETNWRKYKSSSKFMTKLWSYRPIEEFDFICLEEYNARGALSYAETWTLCFVEAPTNNTWYNTRIEKVSWPVKERVTNRHKERLKAAINFEEFRE